MDHLIIVYITGLSCTPSFFCWWLRLSGIPLSHNQADALPSLAWLWLSIYHRDTDQLCEGGALSHSRKNYILRPYTRTLQVSQTSCINSPRPCSRLLSIPITAGFRNRAILPFYDSFTCWFLTWSLTLIYDCLDSTPAISVPKYDHWIVCPFPARAPDSLSLTHLWLTLDSPLTYPWLILYFSLTQQLDWISWYTLSFILDFPSSSPQKCMMFLHCIEILEPSTSFVSPHDPTCMCVWDRSTSLQNTTANIRDWFIWISPPWGHSTK